LGLPSDIQSFSGEKGLDREAHVSAKDAPSRASARFSRAHEDDRWPQSARRASRAWPQAHHRRLIHHNVVRAARLRRSNDIAAVRAEGRALRRAAFSARARANGLSQVRLAVTAPRSVGASVARNRARRRVREAFRRALVPMGPGNGLDLLVTVRREAGTADFGRLEADAASTLVEAGR
jgi:ribonuclease P protein component